MPTQRKLEHSKGQSKEPETVQPKEIDESKLTEDIDAILDEIDEVLEVEAETFVKSFVQKGGE